MQPIHSFGKTSTAAATIETQAERLIVKRRDDILLSSSRLNIAPLNQIKVPNPFIVQNYCKASNIIDLY